MSKCLAASQLFTTEPVSKIVFHGIKDFSPRPSYSFFIENNVFTLNNRKRKLGKTSAKQLYKRNEHHASVFNLRANAMRLLCN